MKVTKTKPSNKIRKKCNNKKLTNISYPVTRSRGQQKLITSYPRDNNNTFILPTEILVQILSYLSHKDLYSNIRVLSPRLAAVTSDASLWTEIVAGRDVSTDDLLGWLQNANKLKIIHLFSRNDINVIIKQVVTRCFRTLEEIRILHCCGSRSRVGLDSTAMCRLLTRCNRLQSISLHGSKMASCKFFRLLGSRESVENKQTAVKYSGSASVKQLREFIQYRKLSSTQKLAYFSIEDPRFLNSSRPLEVYPDNDDQIERILDDIEHNRFRNDNVVEVVENLIQRQQIREQLQRQRIQRQQQRRQQLQYYQQQQQQLHQHRVEINEGQFDDSDVNSNEEDNDIGDDDDELVHDYF